MVEPQQIVDAATSLIRQWDERMRPLPPELFHYTDTSGLLGILENASIRATHFGFLNDSREVRYGFELAMEQLEAARKDPQPPLCEQTIAHVVRSREWMMAKGGSEFDVYLTSFSEDGDLLSQWRGYGQTGAGYSIGIDPGKLEPGKVPVAPDGKPLFLRLLYDPDEQRQLIRDVLQAILEPLKGESPDVENAEALVTTAAGAINRALFHLALMFKAPGFREEREWRAVTVRTLTSIRVSADLRFRATADQRLVPYVELDLRGSGGSMPLSRIVCGPRHDYEQARAAVVMLLRKVGHHRHANGSRLEVERSSTAFR
ncbi:MAG: DUF2971 domain-containing protein [Planctomycetota bacterium]